MPTVRIAMATCAGNAFADTADAPLVRAFSQAGMPVERIDWRSTAVDWASFNACLVRSTWDWYEHPDEFRAWVRRTAAVTRVFNEPSLLEWSLDKTYLADLQQRGVTCVPTTFALSTDRGSIDRAISSWLPGRSVIKPTLGATAFRTAVIDSSIAIDRWFRDNAGYVGMLAIQPFFESITTWGEVSVICIDGEFSHAVRKLPVRGDFRVQGEFGGKSTLIECPSPERELAARCMDSLTAPHMYAPLYARIDMIRSDAGEPMVIECELVEPELFFDLHPPCAHRLVSAIARRIMRT